MRERMHSYSYDGCDSDSPGSDPFSGSDSEASGTESQQSLVILLDDDDDEFEESVHPLPSHRPKRPLPRSFCRSYRSQVKENMVRGMETPFPEVYHTISCAPAVGDKSLEELRVECYRQSQVATREPPKPVSGGMGCSIPPNFFPWRESEGDAISSVGQVGSPFKDVSMDD